MNFHHRFTLSCFVLRQARSWDDVIGIGSQGFRNYSLKLLYFLEFYGSGVSSTVQSTTNAGACVISNNENTLRPLFFLVLI